VARRVDGSCQVQPAWRAIVIASFAGQLRRGMEGNRGDRRRAGYREVGGPADGVSGGRRRVLVGSDFTLVNWLVRQGSGRWSQSSTIGDSSITDDHTLRA